jgi:hypothetical protein
MAALALAAQELRMNYFTLGVLGFSVGTPLLSRALLLGLQGVFVLMAGHWLADISWFSFVGFATHKGKPYLSGAAYRRILKVAAVLLILSGSRFILLR